MSSGRLERARAKCNKSRTHLFNSESPALDMAVISVVHKMGTRCCCCSSVSRKDANKVACSGEPAGTANAADSVCNGSKDALLTAAIYNPQLPEIDESSERTKPSFSNSAHCRCQSG